MKKGATAAISSILSQSPGTVLATLFFFLAGLSSGIFLELFLSPEEKLQMADYLTKNLLTPDLEGAMLPPVFLQSLGNNMGLLVLIFLLGISVIGFPAAFLAVAYKGMALGFSASLLMDSMAGKGAAIVLLSMVPQNLVLIPVLLTGATAAASLSGRIFAGRQKGIKKSLAQNTGPYFSLYIILCAAAFCGCLIEAFISPALLQLAG